MTTIRSLSIGRLSLSTLGVAVALLAIASSPVQGQARPSRTLVSINPLGLPFKYVSGELEQKVNPFATVGASVSYLDTDGESYASLEAKFRLYPNEEAFQGFSIGLAAGLSRLSEDVPDFSGSSSNQTSTNPTIAVIADYNWLLGKTKRVLVGTGVGAKRIFGDEAGFGDINFAYPTVRFQVGVLY